MLDSDLAELYGVGTKYLNKMVKRNLKRFPSDFCFQPNSDELRDLRFQIGTTNKATSWNHKRRQAPYLFSENGVAMLSSILNSDNAIEVNIAIMRIFTKLRMNTLSTEDAQYRINQLESEIQKVFRIIFTKLDCIQDQIDQKLPKLNPNRKRIGLKE